MARAIPPAELAKLKKGARVWQEWLPAGIIREIEMVSAKTPRLLQFMNMDDRHDFWYGVPKSGRDTEYRFWDERPTDHDRSAMP